MAKIMMRDLSPELTEDELRELDALDEREITYDEESPEMSKDMLAQFHRFDQVPVRISDSDMKKVKAMNGEPGRILSRLLNLAINDTEMLRKCAR